MILPTLLALTPLLIFGTIGVWVARMIWKARRPAPQNGAPGEPTSVR